jgi:hypothetical protein
VHLFDLNPAQEIVSADGIQEHRVICRHVTSDHTDHLVVAFAPSDESALAPNQPRHLASLPTTEPSLLP